MMYSIGNLVIVCESASRRDRTGQGGTGLLTRVTLLTNGPY